MKTKYAILLSCMLISFGMMAQKSTIGFVYPAGGQRGGQIDIEIGGLNISQASKVIFSTAGVRGEIIPKPVETGTGKKKKGKKLGDQNSPQLADRVFVRVTLDKNAPLGLSDIRLETPKGVTNKLFFEVGQYADMKEGEKSTFQTPNEVKQLPATLCGQIMAGEVDYYKFKAPKGATFVAETKARAFVPYIADAVPGWFQAVIRITDMQGKEIAYCDDYKEQVDPVAIFTIPEDGEYVLAIHDAIYRGREDFTYCIQLGEIPFVESIYPEAVSCKKSTEVTLQGVNLKSNKMTVRPREAGSFTVRGANKQNLQSNAMPMIAVDSKYKLVSNGNLEDNLVVADYFNEDYQIKRYPIQANADDTFNWEVVGRRLGSLADVKMTLLDDKGKVVCSSDDVENSKDGLITHHADPQMNYQFKKSANYFLELEDLTERKGQDHFFILQPQKEEVPYDVFVSPANISVGAGSTVMFQLSINRKEGFNEPLQVFVDGLPEDAFLSNTIIMPSMKKWNISITIPKKSTVKNYDLNIFTAPLNDQENPYAHRSKAYPADDMMQAFYYTHHILSDQFTMQVLPAAPYQISYAPDIMEHFKEGLSFEDVPKRIALPLRIERNADFKDTITLSLGQKNGLFIFEPLKVSANEKDVVFYLNLNEKKVKSGKNRVKHASINIDAEVKGEFIKQGKKTFQNALYKEITPLLEVTLGKITPNRNNGFKMKGNHRMKVSNKKQNQSL